jgi:hypothetical protein
MGKYTQQVAELKKNLIQEIKNYFIVNDDVLQLEFFKALSGIRVLEENYDYDYSVVPKVVKFITNDNFVITDEGEELRIDELDIDDIATILDELISEQYKVLDRKEVVDN